MLAANLAYRASSVRFAQSRGYDVSLREPGSADHDLAFLGGADTFIAGGGGYSLAAFVVSYALCGTVLFPQRICDRSPNSRNRKRAPRRRTWRRRRSARDAERLSSAGCFNVCQRVC